MLAAEQQVPISTPSYVLESCSTLIYARFEGEWNVSIDLEFMTELGERMLSMKCNHWALFVDMRKWVMPADVIDAMQRAKVHLNRRNQIAECWLVSDEMHGAFIAPLIRAAGIPLKRCWTLEDSKAWLKEQGVNINNLPDCLLDAIVE